MCPGCVTLSFPDPSISAVVVRTEETFVASATCCEDFVW